VEELEVKLLEREELDVLTLNRELDGLATRESTPDHRKATLEMERMALEDARLNVLTRELAVEAREAGLRFQEAGLAVRERQLVERLMQELTIAQKRLEDLQASRFDEAQRVWNFLG
jgi:predicted transcriptional regulator